ncbi:MAG: NAD(P)/FAD-dependent oxidoreductase [Acidobacteria bacterium]|nr:NAD(P)/FAD-dependent oxidoreductase [Acidobacteriota bacterium]
MTNREKILIVGGGVSGASLAIRMSKNGSDVTLVERDKFPRQKLCGEFVSPECLRHFEDLGVMGEMNAIGGDPIFETRFYSQNGNSLCVPSGWFFDGEKGALSISRAEMDLRMLERARECGAKVFEESRCFKVKLGIDGISSVFVRDSRGASREFAVDMVIDATGRSRVLGKLIDRQRNIRPEKSKERFVGFKAHFKNVRIDHGVCEIYFFDGGYGGLSFIENEKANHCFIIDAREARKYGGDADEILKRTIFRNSRAFETLGAAEKTFDWLAVSVENFGSNQVPDISNLFTVGDAAAFIDPFTGSGMLMALESSELLANAAAREDAADISKRVKLIKSAYERDHARFFRRRLQICKLMHRFSFSPKLASFVIGAGNKSGPILKAVAGMTR